MNFLTGEPDEIGDYLATLHEGQWYEWAEGGNPCWENLVVLNPSVKKPTKKELEDGHAQMIADWKTAKQTKIDARQTALNKLMALGLTEEEALALGVKSWL